MGIANRHHAPTVRRKIKCIRENTLRILLSRLAKDERGLSTAEYAVGTVAVAGLGGILIKLLTSDAVKDLIFSVITSAFKAIFGG